LCEVLRPSWSRDDGKDSIQGLKSRPDWIV